MSAYSSHASLEISSDDIQRLNKSANQSINQSGIFKVA